MPGEAIVGCAESLQCPPYASLMVLSSRGKLVELNQNLVRPYSRREDVAKHLDFRTLNVKLKNLDAPGLRLVEQC